nr:hypothetical protein RVX_0534 [Nitratidesulfovibrio sp. HK-II]
MSVAATCAGRRHHVSTGFTGISEGAAAGNGGRATPDGPGPGLHVQRASWRWPGGGPASARPLPVFPLPPPLPHAPVPPLPPCRPLPMGRPRRM